MTRRNPITAMLGACALALAMALTMAVAAPPASAQSDPVARFTDADRAEIELIIRDYLLENPGLMLEVLAALERQQEQALANRRDRALEAERATLYDHPDTPYAGNAEGDITLVEFVDYNCGFCKRMVGPLNGLLREDSGLRIVYKEWPILAPSSDVAARAALAAHRQGLYHPYHTAMMQFRGQLTDSVIFSLADEVGLDLGRLRSDMAADWVDQELARNRALADALGIRGTPAFVLDDQVIAGAVDPGHLRDLFAQLREAPEARSTP